MNWITAVIVLLPSCLSLCVSGIYAYIALKKAQEPPKDEIWETATKIICARGTPGYSGDDFADLYEELKLFKEHGCSLSDIETLSSAVNAKHQAERAHQRPGSDPAP